MHESYVQRSTVIAWLLWTISAALALALWLMAAIGGSAAVGRALMLTGVFSLAVTVTWHTHVYAARLCALIRVTAGLGCEEDLRPASLRSVSPRR